MAAYFGSVSDKMSLGDSNAKSALVAPAEGDAPYTLLVGEFSRAGQDYEGPDMLMLVRVDSESKQVTLVSVPANAQVSLSDGNAHRIADAQLLGGDEYLVSTVASFTGVNVSHLIKTDAEGLESLVDYLGGLTVDIGQEVDDPNAGDTYIPAGTQTLDGKTVLTLCRALNFAEGDETRAENQQKVVLALAEKLLQTNAFSIIPTLDAIAGTVRTDYSASDAMGLIDSLRGVDLSRVHAVRMPGYALTSSTTGAEYFIASEDEWAAMLEAIEAGEDPTPADETALSVDPASFKITVRNGSGITGGAQQMADSLAEGGFQVTETGNADQYVYNETLVVYQDDAYKEAAESVVKYLGTGRAVPSNGFYAFETDGLGHVNVMDDSNVPSLMAAPYLGYCAPDDPTYLATRRTLLSDENPYYYEGEYLKGIGSPHTPPRYVWPIALSIEAMTSDSKDFKAHILDRLVATDAGTHLMHEGIDVDDPTKYTREWFSWSNMMFCELVMDYFDIHVKH